MKQQSLGGRTEAADDDEGERMERETRGLSSFGMDPVPAQSVQGQHQHLIPAVPQQLQSTLGFRHFLDIFKCGKVTWLSVAWLSPSEGHASIPGEGTAESLEKERAGNVQERQQRRLGKASALAVQTQGSLSTRRDCCWKGMEHPQHIFSFFNNVVLQNPAVTRREEKGIEHFSINTALLFIITCWYF